MLTRVDHVMICVPDLERGIEVYRRIGFSIFPGGAHTGRATHNAIAFTGEEYLEVLSIRDRAAVTPGGPDERLAHYLDKGGGFRVVALQSDDLEGDVAAMRRHGVDVGPIQDGGRRTPAGQELRWRAAFPGPGDPLPVFFIQHLTPLEERRRQVPKVGDHPNGALRVDRVYVAVPDVAAASRLYARVLGLPEPRIQRGAVIKADMAVFDLGPTGLTVAQPAEPGPAAEALGRSGPGPFQVLYRTSSMDGAVRWMTGHGLPEPAQGVRNTGERAILVGPQYTGGAYVGFV
ncbi:MAG TPA: VOC family protein, partial [Methylomirabilota bacterium]|nr:VOC family protein [Methylomirabilota bacterium]